MTSTLCQPVSVKDMPLPGLVDKPEVVKVKDLPLQKLLSAQKYWRQFWFWWLKSWRICPYCLCAQSLVLTRLCLSVWSGAKSVKLNVSCRSWSRCSTLYGSEQGFCPSPENGDAPFWALGRVPGEPCWSNTEAGKMQEQGRNEKSGLTEGVIWLCV